MKPIGKRRRKRFSTPRKGSKARNVLLGLLQKNGITAKEAIERGFITQQSDMSALLDQFTNTGGWDIRGFAVPATGRAFQFRYRIVGRLRWGEGYRSFIDRSAQIDR